MPLKTIEPVELNQAEILATQKLFELIEGDFQQIYELIDEVLEFFGNSSS